MARERLLDAQVSMEGGLNAVSDESMLSENQLRRAINARLTEFGAIVKRLGTKRVSTQLNATFPVQNGFSWRKDSGSPEILAVCNGELYTTEFGAYPWTWTKRTGALSTSVRPMFAKFRDAGGNDVTYISDGGLLNKWNGTTLTTDISGTVGTRVVTVHNERLWSCGCGNAPQSVFYSALNNGDTLANAGAGGGEIIVRTFGDEIVVGLASVNTSLLIFHKRGISRITGYGQDDITASPQGVTSDVGTIAPASIVVVDNTCFFVSERGLYACNESDVAPVGSMATPDPILPVISQLTDAEFGNIRAVVNRSTRELWISMPGHGVLVYNTILRAWSGPWDTGYIGPGTTALFETLNAQGLPVVLKGDGEGWVSLCDAPGVFVDNQGSDGTGGEAFAMTAQFKRFYCGDEVTAKALRWGYLTAQLRGSKQARVEWNTGDSFGSFSLEPSTDQTWGGASTEWGVGSWGGAGGISYRIPMGGTGYYIDVSVIDSGEALPVISRFQIETFALGRR